MINVKYIKDEYNAHGSECVIINDIYDEHSFRYLYSNRNGVNIYNEAIINSLLPEKINEIFKHFDELEITMCEKFYPKSISEYDRSMINLAKKNMIYKIKFDFIYHTDLWKNPYSPKDFCEQIELLCKDNNYLFSRHGFYYRISLISSQMIKMQNLQLYEK